MKVWLAPQFWNRVKADIQNVRASAHQKLLTPHSYLLTQKVSHEYSMCMPGDNVEMTIELIHPVAMEQGLTFAIREGGRTDR